MPRKAKPLTMAEIAPEIISARPTLLKTRERNDTPIIDLIQEGLLFVSPELAHRILAEAIYERQRPVRIKHLEALAMQMRNREWTQGTQIHFGRLPDGSLHLVNGQHRLYAVINSDAIVQFQVLITDVANEEGLNHLYRRHDRLAALRSVTDTLTAEGILEKHKLLHQLASGIFGAMLIIDSDFTAFTAKSAYEKRSDEARLRMAENWWELGYRYQDAITRAPTPIKRRLTTFGVVAVGLVSFKYQERIADEFWRGLANNDKLSRRDPRAAYLRYLLTERPGSAFNAAKAAAVAWNSFYHEEDREIIRVFSTPVEIDGTPFVGSVD